MGGSVFEIFGAALGPAHAQAAAPQALPGMAALAGELEEDQRNGSEVWGLIA